MTATHFYPDDNNATPSVRQPLSYSGERAAAFRARFVAWAEPRGLELPATADDLNYWVADYIDATGDNDGSEDYLMRETV